MMDTCGEKRSSAAMMAQLTDHVWSFYKQFGSILKGA